MSVALREHPFELVRNLEFRIFGERAGSFGDVHGQVGDSLQLGVDLEHGGRAAQVDRHRLMQREDLEALFLDLAPRGR